MGSWVGLRKRSEGANRWPERLAALVAMAGVVLGSLPGLHVRTWQDAGSDFKTVYASATCFFDGVKAYSFTNIGGVFAANGVVLPASWYAHAPTYPPFTFAVVAPLTRLPMVAAVYVWMCLSALALVFAIWAMATMSDERLGLPRAWRLLLIPLVAAAPVVSFGLQIGNVSVMAAALCIVAAMSEGTLRPSWRAAALTVSVLLKPHIALWVLVGMFVSRNRGDRALVLRTAAYCAGALVFCGVWFSMQGPFGLQLGDYARMVGSEIATGCLNPRNHQLLPPVAEIPSLESMLGFFLHTPWMQMVNVALLAVMGGLLLLLSRAPRNNETDTRLELLGAWSVFGLIATYHRTHDATMLFVLLPWMLSRWRRNALDAPAWGVLMLNVVMSVGSFPPRFDWISSVLRLPSLAAFLVFRQSAVAAFGLMMLLLGHLWMQSRKDRRTERERESPLIEEEVLEIATVARTRWSESLKGAFIRRSLNPR